MDKQKYYHLKSDIALRSWKLPPRAYYVKGQRFARWLSQEDFMLLLQCDGKHELKDSERLQQLTELGICFPCEYITVVWWA